jgi:hypothetical protein
MPVENENNVLHTQTNSKSGFLVSFKLGMLSFSIHFLNVIYICCWVIETFQIQYLHMKFDDCSKIMLLKSHENELMNLKLFCTWKILFVLCIMEDRSGFIITL